MLSGEALSIIEHLSARITRFYEHLLATLDIRVQAYISSCVDAVSVDAIESSFLNFADLKQKLRMQNISDLMGPVFSESQPGNGKRAATNDGGAPAAKRVQQQENRQAYPSIALRSYMEWNKVRPFVQHMPMVEGVPVCGRYYCRQVCNSHCDLVHARLSPSTVSAVERWIAESKANAARASRS